ncbi:MAG: LysR family transcriptional regulator [Alphaproteobacteria bacterium]|nr:LysR family transcriptional regulator [Alphaproteobacteria bacterium]MBV9371725.1 LysR family transcriptional regulator [Alphaproteobacteria bacterium]MBV9902501.1 LysR family transcriptional regulator [Alphaproteobacteria bacterium]
MAEFDWNDLKPFLAVARTGRLTAAAARLGVDHSTLSRRVAALEHRLGAKLFDRSPGGYDLTEQGTRLVPIAEEMERLALGAAERVGGTALSVEGTVRIGSPEGFGSWFLAPRIAALRERHPRLRVQLVAASAVFSLSRRDADVVISVSRPPSGRLTVSRLIDYDLALYAAPAYLAAQPPIGGAADLRGHRFVTYIEDLLHFPELDFVRHVAPEGAASLESSNLVAQLRATLAGAGLCVLPAFLAAGDPRLVRVLPDEVALTRSLWMIVHQDLAELARVKAVVRFIREAVEAERALFKLG